MAACFICHQPFDPESRPCGCRKDVCGRGCQEVLDRRHRSRAGGRGVDPRLDKLLNDFDYVFPPYSSGGNRILSRIVPVRFPNARV